MIASWKRSVESWNGFWFTKQNPELVARVRIVICVLVAIQFLIYMITGSSWFGAQGWLDVETGRYLIGDGIDGTGSTYRWSLLYRFPGATMGVAFLGFLASVFCAAGVGARVAPAIAWCALAMFHHRAPMLITLSEPLMSAFLVYLVIEPGRLVWNGIGGLASGPDRVSANIALRLMQCHFGLWMAFSMFSMLGNPAWWNGEAGWGLIEHRQGLLALGDGWQSLGQFLTHFVVGLQIAILACLLLENWRWMGRWILYVFVLCMLLLMGDWMYAAVLLAASLTIWPVRFDFKKVGDEPHR